MPKEKKVQDGSVQDPASDDLFMVLGTIGDTTWRMFVPPALFTLLGVWFDRQFGSKPWCMVIGIAVGTLGAVLLVRRQLKNVGSRR